MHKLKLPFLFIILTVLLSACDGSGGVPNSAPSANAGLEQNVNEGTIVELSGSGTDSDGSVSAYAWIQISGAKVVLNNANTQTASFMAPNTGTATFIQLGFRLTVTDDGGATGSDTMIVTIASTNQSPSVNAGADQVVNEQSTVSLDASSASDIDGSITAYSWVEIPNQTVTLSGANTATPTFTAPALSSTEILTFAVTVVDNRGATATDTVNITVNNVVSLNNLPVANAGVDILTYSSQSVSLIGSASFDTDGSIADYVWMQTMGATVTLTNADAATASFTAPVVTVDTSLNFELTVTDNEGAMATDLVNVLITPESTVITITGKASYDNVPHNPDSSLNYNDITQDPIRGAVVEVIRGSTILASDITDNAGQYSLEVSPDAGTVFVRVKAHALLTATAFWDAKVVDNTNDQALYVLDSSAFTVATTDIMRPTMNAGSGWTGSSYAGIRAAAPFHILDRVMDANLKLQAIDPAVVLPSVDINWSANNSPTVGTGTTVSDYIAELRNGDIGTSFYATFPSGFLEFSGPQFFILGTENVDTDEYDGHVIVHEWGHYFENVLSRSDSIGGAHGRRDRLDMRLAFGEGFGNAWSAIITDDPIYRDSFDSRQSLGVGFDIEDNAITNPGWYSEGSVQSILYDIYDSNNDGVDVLSLGLKPIYDVLVGPQKTTNAFTSIFTFAEYIRQAKPIEVSGINSILAGQSIDGSGIWATDESNDAGATPATLVLPVYTELIVDGASQQVCSTDDYDTLGNSNDFSVDSGNKLSVFRFIRFTLSTTADYRFTISAPSTTADPAMIIYLNGVEIGFIDNFGDGSAENAVGNLEAGNYTAVVYEYDNSNDIGSLITTGSSDECFDVQISTP